MTIPAAPSHSPHRRRPTATLVMPTMNEVEGIKWFMPQVRPEWFDEMIIMDGGSTDGTVEYCREQGYPLYRQTHRGLPPALSEAFGMVKTDLVVTVSPDGNCLPEHIPTLLETIIGGGYDMVIVSRYKGAARSDDDDFMTGLGNRGLTATVNLLFRGRYTDVMGIYRAYTRDAVRRMRMVGMPFETWMRRRYIDMSSFDLGSSIRAAKLRLKVAELSGDEPKRIGGDRKLSITRNGFGAVLQIAEEAILRNNLNSTRKRAVRGPSVMIPDMLNSVLRHEAFTGSAVYAALRELPLGFIDIGARGGVHELVAPMAALTAVLGFEPDTDECARLTAEARAGSPWAALEFEPAALAARSGDATLYRFVVPLCDSLIPANQDFVRRYNVKTMESRGSLGIRTTTLDEVLFQRRAGDRLPWGEFLKLDTQGTELEILRGAERTLAERTVAIWSEVFFTEAYEDQPMFSDVEKFLRERGFSFYGFATMHSRSGKRLDKRREAGRERTFFADAVFFKDPLPPGARRPALSDRAAKVLFACALLTGFYDFALEVAETTWAGRDRAEADRIRRAVSACAALDPAQAARDAIALAERVRGNPGRANIEVGGFVDERRHRADYDDVTKAAAVIPPPGHRESPAGPPLPHQT